MEWLKNEVLPMVRHFIASFIAAIVMFFTAIGLTKVEIWCREQKYPSDICYGLHAVSVVIFSLDGILVCGIVAITALKLLRRTWKK